MSLNWGTDFIETSWCCVPIKSC